MTLQRKSIAIIGCGWLGKPLAKQLINQNYSVIVSTTRDEKLTQLQAENFKAVKLQLPCSPDVLANSAVFSADMLVIAITPQIRYGNKSYAEHIKALVNAAKQNGCEYIILLSSSAVYDGLSGQIDENTSLLLPTEKTQIINKAEQSVLALNTSNTVSKGCVLRLAGLVGESRYPGKFLAGKTQLENAHGAVNLIHQQDAIGIISVLLRHQAQGVFNGVSSAHPARVDFYTQACQLQQLPLPEFIKQPANENSPTLTGKIIVGNKISEQLAYQFVYPDITKWLEQVAENSAKIID
jgi:nucleoside-diphosphate-sugar epimerase